MRITRAPAATESCTLRRRNAANDEHEGRNGPVETRNDILSPLSVFGSVNKQPVAPLTEKGHSPDVVYFYGRAICISRGKIKHHIIITTKQTRSDCVVGA